MEQTSKQPDYILTLFEVCEILNKSSRTISRYVHKNILHPVGVKSRQGTLEYRFSRAEVDDIKLREEQMRSLNFPNLMEMRSDAAAFASMSYPAATVSPQSQFAIPGISYPVAPGQNQPIKFAEQMQAQQQQQSQAQQQPQQQSQPQTQRIENDMPAMSSGAFKDLQNSDSLVHGGTSEVSGQASNHDNRQIITLLKETTEMLRGQLRVKDDQIKNLDEKIGQLIERNRETNILLKGLQDKMVLLEKPKDERKEARPEQAAPQTDEAQPTAAPAPRRAEAPVSSGRVRVIYSDTVPAVDAQDGAGGSRSGQSDDEGDWDNGPSKKDRKAGGSFFGKMFR